MRKLVIGILAHVDAGKTTLSEGMLYTCGTLKRLGRVDHQDAFLDTEALERERGITIFSKQAVLPLPGVEVTLLDTPGHVDFSSEMERTLQVLDCAILVISGTDGVQGHTRTLWRLLERYHIPTLLFVNKMDLAGADRAVLMAELQRLDSGCVDFGQEGPGLQESVAMCDEGTLERYLERGQVEPEEIRALVERRRLFPCWFGSALKLEGVAEFLEGVEQYAPRKCCPPEFGARVYKVARDAQGVRLTYLKITGGSLRVKTPLTGGEGEMRWEEKADQIRIYSGAKYRAVEEVEAGTVCAVTGLSRTRPGEGLGFEAAGQPPVLEPVLTYRLELPEGCDPHAALRQLRELEEEDPQLHILWDERLREIHIQLMGEVQLEILRQVIAQRFGVEVSFGAGSIVYRETIAAPVEGVGHFEPLRHYAEVHLLLEPGERGSGLRVGTACSTDQLDLNWQRLILTHLLEREHLGVLTGSPITDLRITLVAGRAHEKHTEGGDFRQATYRAVRQGLRMAQGILLEPWYDFTLELPADCLGRAMADVQRMSGRFAPADHQGDMAVLTGSAPVSELGDYWNQVAAYTRGLGQLTCTLRGYEPCHNTQEVMEQIGYDPDRDTDNPADSVFCSHGAGVTVKWDQVREHMHLDSGWRPPEERRKEDQHQSVPRPAMSYADSAKMERELEAIFTRTYGPIKPRAFAPAPKAPARKERPWKGLKPRFQGEEYLLVDGYNIIHAWDDLKRLAAQDLDGARLRLMDILSNYQGWRKCHVILVFDAYRVKGNPGSVEKYHNIHVVYTKEAETADMYIEKTTYEIAREHRVRVATSDGLEQVIILGHGAQRMSARELRFEIDQVQAQIRRILEP